ncbi:YncE family protein [Mycolicibacterium novocastrense]|nr:YncE family protein [Mycolicibacterium novocastrense]
MGGSPSDIVISPDGTRAYVANYNHGTVTVLDIDPTSPTYNTVIDVSPLPGGQNITVGPNPHSLAVTPDGKRLYVTHYTGNGGNTVTVVNIDTTSVDYGKVIDTNPAPGLQNITVGTHPAGIAINRTGTRAYVANSDGGSISVIDIDPNSETYNQVINADLSTPANEISVPTGRFQDRGQPRRPPPLRQQYQRQFGVSDRHQPEQPHLPPSHRRQPGDH